MEVYLFSEPLLITPHRSLIFDMTFAHKQIFDRVWSANLQPTCGVILALYHPAVWKLEIPSRESTSDRLSMIRLISIVVCKGRGSLPQAFSDNFENARERDNYFSLFHRRALSVMRDVFPAGADVHTSSSLCLAGFKWSAF